MKPIKFPRKSDKNQVFRMSDFHFMNEKLQSYAVFQKLQPHCGTANRCPIKIKLCQSHTVGLMMFYYIIDNKYNCVIIKSQINITVIL